MSSTSTPMSMLTSMQTVSASLRSVRWRWLFWRFLRPDRSGHQHVAGFISHTEHSTGPCHRFHLRRFDPVTYVYVLSVSKSSHYSLARDEVGRSADVIISIPNEGVGTIAFDNISGRVTLGARSTTGKQIAKGSVVRVEKIVGRVAFCAAIRVG